MVFFSKQRLALASASPRRRDLLASAGLTFDIVPSQCPEPDPLPGEPATDYALRMAGVKLHDAVARLLDGNALLEPIVVLAADTVVFIDGRILGKPADSREAKAMLDLLCPVSGPPLAHHVATACRLLRVAKQDKERRIEALDAYCVVTEVVMGPVPEPALAAYAQSKEPLDKAGAYAIQGHGGFLVRSIRGSYSNVVGLPLTETLDRLLACGVIEPAASTCARE